VSDESEDYWNLDAITCAFCLGDADRIRAAFLGHYKRAFRMGDVADRFVEFPVCYADVVVHLPNAVADTLGVCRGPELKPMGIGGGDDEGMWVEVWPQQWVAQIASVKPEQVQGVLALWARLAQEGHDAAPENWELSRLAVALRQLLDIASIAVANGKPLIGLAAI
jgi:hypothetical protein